MILRLFLLCENSVLNKSVIIYASVKCVQKYSYWYIKLRIYIYTETYGYVSESKIIFIPSVSNIPKKNTQKYVQTLF